jgi:hypothetical protein
MMRDRDLADVNVSGEGVWDRKSDACWEDLKAREEDLLRSLGSEHGSVPSLDHSIESDDDESLPSTNHSDDPEARRRMAARMGRREQRRARRKQIDWRIAHEVGWRGFKWEEGAGGEGLPRGFRGLRGGPLTEDGIKAIMTKVGLEDRLWLAVAHCSSPRHRLTERRTSTTTSTIKRFSSGRSAPRLNV